MYWSEGSEGGTFIEAGVEAGEKAGSGATNAKSMLGGTETRAREAPNENDARCFGSAP